MYSCTVEQIRIPIHKQMVQLNIYQTYMHLEHLEHMLEYLIDERGIIISYNLYFY